LRDSEANPKNATFAENDLDRLREIFNRNSMIVLNENTLKMPMKVNI